MYQIYANETLIYDSTLEDYKIVKGSVELETNKSGKFSFAIYPDHFYYDNFIRLKTVITVYKSGKIIFRGRILNDVTDYYNNKVLTCEGELGFLQDSIIRPFDFTGTPEELFRKIIREHNSQVDGFQSFKIGTVTVVDPNNYIARSNSEYESALSNINSRLIEDSLGGYIFITHGEDGTEIIPTINYLADFTNVSSQEIQFGSNLKNYTKTVKAEEIATAIIPLGAEVDDGDDNTENKKLTIASVNNGIDYVYHQEGVDTYGFICKTISWDNVTDPTNLKKKAEAYLEETIKQNITIELNAIDLHLLDKSIESFKLGDYIRVISEPHNFAETLLCNKQTIDLLKPENDSITLGYNLSTFTAINAQTSSTIKNITNIDKSISHLNSKTNEYIIAEDRLTSLMAQSFGLFKSVEKLVDGSDICYLHDKQTLEESTTIWKMTADAFSVSNDGGKTWSAGLDSNGNAVLSALAVIGLNASWIKAGKIMDNLGKSYWDLDKGELYINGYFRQETPEGIRSIDIMDNQISIYDWTANGEKVGSINAIKNKNTGKAGIDIVCTPGNKVGIGCISEVGEETALISTSIEIDSETYQETTPWIRNTVSGTLFPDTPGGGIIVENGLIKDWNMPKATGQISPLYSVTLNNGKLTAYSRVALTIVNGLITNWEIKEYTV